MLLAGAPRTAGASPPSISIDRVALTLAREAGASVDDETLVRQLDAIADACRSQTSHPDRAIDCLNTELFSRRAFRYDRRDPSGRDPDNFYLPRVMARRQGVCTGLSTLYLAVARRLNLRVRAVVVPGHVFLQYDDGRHVRNIDTSRSGESLSDEYWIRSTRLSPESRRHGAYLRPLTDAEFVAYLLTEHAAFRLTDHHVDDATARLDEALTLDPRNVKAWYLKASILAQTARIDSALGCLRRALALDPRAGQALNLRGLLLAKQSRYEQALRAAPRALGPVASKVPGQQPPTAAQDADRWLREARVPRKAQGLRMQATATQPWAPRRDDPADGQGGAPSLARDLPSAPR